jgi:hypothetical protein
VLGGLISLLATAAVAAAVLVVPPAALAGGCGGGPSAVQVYKECLPNGGGGSQAGGGAQTGGHGSGYRAVVISPRVAKALKTAGKKGRSLQSLVKAYGPPPVIQSSHASGAPGPTAIGSAFDLGSGPTVLLIGLAGTVILLLAAGGYRGLRHRKR